MHEIKGGDRVKYSAGYLAAKKSMPAVYRPDRKALPAIINPAPPLDELENARGTVQDIETIGMHQVALVLWNDGSLTRRFIMNLEKVNHE